MRRGAFIFGGEETLMKRATFLMFIIAAFSHGVTAARTEAVEVGGGPRQRWDCVAFVADGDIYIINLDGTGLTRLTADDASDHSSPAFSPDGTQIAYVSGEKGAVHRAVYVMDADGSNKRRLSRPKGEWNFKDMSPGFPPDGERVVATRTYFPPCSIVFFPLSGGEEEIFKLKIRDAWQRERPDDYVGPGPWGDVSAPAFTADGLKIAYRVTPNCSGSLLWIVDADGSGARLLAKDNPYSHVFSPDGKKLAFFTWTEEGKDIAVINADGTGRRQLTKGDRDSFSPSFSPDGKKIIYESSVRSEEKHVAADIYIMNADGSGPRALTQTPENEGGGRFTPDGSKIVFVEGPLTRDDPAEPRIYVMNADGSSRRFLVAGRKFSLGPSLVEGRLLDSYGNSHDVVEEPETSPRSE
jgi:TolB protein